VLKAEIDAPLASGAVLTADPETFRRNFDRHCFTFEHRLAESPLFAPERLLEIAKQMAVDPADVYYDAGDVRVEQRWDEVPACALPIDELLHRIETANAWVVLRKAEKFPEYAALLDACIAQIEALSGRNLRGQIKLRNAIIFINSPHRVSSYHIDRECNFLLQIRGSKTISIHDRGDRQVLPEEEIERFWTVDPNSAVYKPAYDDRASTYELVPGRAVHIPVNAPHWVKNGPDVSVSLSINFHYVDSVLADLYRANYRLRSLGLKPLPPRKSAAVDQITRTVYGSIRTAGRAAQGLLPSRKR
jgi:hypothetical protein